LLSPELNKYGPELADASVMADWTTPLTNTLLSRIMTDRVQLLRNKHLVAMPGVMLHDFFADWLSRSSSLTRLLYPYSIVLTGISE